MIKRKTQRVLQLYFLPLNAFKSSFAGCFDSYNLLCCVLFLNKNSGMNLLDKSILKDSWRDSTQQGLTWSHGLDISLDGDQLIL